MQMRAQFLFVAVICLVGVALHGNATEAPPVEVPTEPSQCAVEGWVSFAFDAPVPVYDAPSEAANIRGYLPNDSNSDDDRYSVEFEVTEARPGWLHIRNAQDREGSDRDGNALPPRPVYRGEGWIRSHLAQIGVQSSLGYVRPDTRSPRVLDLEGQWLTEVGQILGIRACSGDWLLLDFMIEDRDAAVGVRAPPATGTAWFRGICSIQETTCDMRSVDDQP